MKVLRTLGMLAAAVLFMTLIPSCNHDLDDDSSYYSEVLRTMSENNKSVSMDGVIDFQILTPKGLTGVAYKSFYMSVKEGGDFKNLDGTSFFAVTSDGRYATEIVTIMAYAESLKGSKPGDMLNLLRVSCGNMLSNSFDIAFATYEGGDIYVKDISNTTITLRFVQVKIHNALGDTYFNGDLTFDIE